MGLPWWLSSKESICQYKRHKRWGFDPRVGKILWRRKWHSTPVFSPGKSYGRRCPAATVHGVAESDTTEAAEHIPQSQVPGIRPRVSFRSHIPPITASRKTFKLRPQGLENRPVGAGGSVCVRENASRQKGTGVCVCIHVLQAKGKWGGAVCVCANICSRQKGKPAPAALGQKQRARRAGRWRGGGRMPQGAGVLEVLGAALRREPPDLKCSHFICEKSTGVSEARGAGSPLTAPWSNAALPSQPPGSAGPHPLSPEMGPGLPPSAAQL